MEQNKERTGKPALMKELNIGLIMDALEKKGQATRVELAALTKLSQPTVNMLIGELVKEQKVISLGIAASTGGRRAELFAIECKRAALAAVLVKEDVIEAVVTDLELHTELHERLMRTEGTTRTEELTVLIGMLFEKRSEIRAICVGVPGSVSTRGEVFAIPMVPEWECFGLKEYLESQFSVSVCVMNDMNAIAAGYLLGRTDHVQNFVYLHAEEAGVGAGIVIDGKLYSGFRSFAGEIGSMLLGTPEEPDAAGVRYATGGEIPKEAKEAAGMGKAVSRVSVEGRMCSDTGKQSRTAILSAAVINLICVLNPEEILFGGDITEEMMRDIYEGCCACLPESVLPRCLAVSNYMADYFNGLCLQAREMLSRHVRVV